MTDKIRVAVLDKNNLLTGSRDITAARFLPDKHIEIGDLPADGSYRWTGKSFEHVSAPPHYTG